MSKERNARKRRAHQRWLQRRWLLPPSAKCQARALNRTKAVVPEGNGAFLAYGVIALMLSVVLGALLLREADNNQALYDRYYHEGEVTSGKVVDVNYSGGGVGPRGSPRSSDMVVDVRFSLPSGKEEVLKFRMNDTLGRVMSHADVLVHYLPDDPLGTATLVGASGPLSRDPEATRQKGWTFLKVAAGLLGLMVVINRRLIWRRLTEGWV